MFRFVNHTNGGMPTRRKQAPQACEACRKRKKRCVHIGEPADGSRDASPAKRVRIQGPSSSTSDSRHETRGASSQNAAEQDSAQQTVEEDTQRPSAPGEVYHNVHFVGDMNPEAAILADTPGTNGDFTEQDGVGTWCSTRISISESLAGRQPWLLKMTPPNIADMCVALLPKKTHFENLKKLYIRDVHRILPVIDMEFVDKSTSKYSQTLLKQAICLAAGANPTAAPYLTLGGDSDRPLSYAEFSQQLISAMRTVLNLGLVEDRLHAIPALVILALFTYSCEDRHVSAELAGQAISYSQTIGLHLRNPSEKKNGHHLSRLFCCVWAVDRLSAAFHGRPVLMHSRDFGRDLEECIGQQESGFRLFLETVFLLDQVIQLYRPHSEAQQSGYLSCFLDFESLIVKAGAYQVDTRILSTIEVLYHAISILSCRKQSHQPSLSSSAGSRQALSAISITTLTQQGNNQLVRMPFVPYAVSLSLSVSYNELRTSKVPMLRARAWGQLRVKCQVLRQFGDMSRTALVMVEATENILQKLDKVCSNVTIQPPDPSSLLTPTSVNSVPPTTSSPERTSIHDWDMDAVELGSNIVIDPTVFENIAGLDIFHQFDSALDLDAIDTILGGKTAMNLGFPQFI